MIRSKFIITCIFCICLFISKISFSQEYTPKRFFNPLNTIDTKQKKKPKNFVEIIQFNRKKNKKEKCDCPDDNNSVSYQTKQFSITNTFNNLLKKLISCNKGFGNLAMHVHFSDGIVVNGIIDESPFDNGDLNVGMQYFDGNLSYDLWLSAPIVDDNNQKYGLRAGVVFFPLGSERIFSPYLGTSIGIEIDYNYESIVQGFQFVDNWYTEIYPLGRLHAGVQYMFRCKLIMKMDVSYAAGSYIDRDGNQFPHYRPWVVWNTVGIRF